MGTSAADVDLLSGEGEKTRCDCRSMIEKGGGPE